MSEKQATTRKAKRYGFTFDGQEMRVLQRALDALGKDVHADDIDAESWIRLSANVARRRRAIERES